MDEYREIIQRAVEARRKYLASGPHDANDAAICRDKSLAIRAYVEAGEAVCLALDRACVADHEEQEEQTP